MKKYLIFGMAGCMLLAGSDWLMIYGDTSFEGNLAWLTTGAAQIPAGRNALALALAFPAVILYCIALFAVRGFLKEEKQRKTYTFLTAVGMTPWLCIHLFYLMILYLFAWMTKAGETELAFEASEALFSHFAWLIPAGEALMLLPFLVLVFWIIRKKSVFSPWMAWNNPLVLYLLLKVLTGFLPDRPFRLAFVNGLMSEAMFLWFLIFLITAKRKELP